MKIIFSNLAIETLQEIVDYLTINWTDKELNNLEKDIEKFAENIQINFKIYPVSIIDNNVREALIGNKMVKIYFEISDDSAYILLFWNNRGDTERLIKLIKNK